jgi:probable phosphoglycerate mutase
MSKTNSASTTKRAATKKAATKRPASRTSVPESRPTSSKRSATKKTASRKKATKAPQPTTILLVRHGQTPTTGKVLPGRAKGLHLAEQGVEQAKIAALRIAELKVSAVYSSPLERAKETAKPISDALGLKTKIDRGLFECDFGDWTGKELVKLNKLPEWQTVQRAPSTFRFPNGESFTEMQTRMVSALDRLRIQHPGETIVCVSHADTIKAAVAHAMGTHLDLFQRIVISPASVSAITWHAGGPIVLAVNSTGRPLTELRPA